MKKVDWGKMSKYFITVCSVFFAWFALCSYSPNSYAESSLLPMQAHDTSEIIDLFLHYDAAQFLTESQYSKCPALVLRYNILDIDISDERILLFLEDNEHYFLRIATWDDALGEYSTIDSGYLPADSWLDTFHDGNAVFLTVPYSIFNVDNSLTLSDWLFITFKNSEGQWYLTSYTDSQSFTAKLSDHTYLFNDYYEPSTEYAWEMDSELLFEGFTVAALLESIDTYNTLYSHRPSLSEEP